MKDMFTKFDGNVVFRILIDKDLINLIISININLSTNGPQKTDLQRLSLH